MRRHLLLFTIAVLAAPLFLSAEDRCIRAFAPDKTGPAICVTSKFPVAAGHYSGSLRFRVLSSLTDRTGRSDNYLRIRLKLWDSAGRELSPTASHHDKVLDASRLDFPLTNVDASLLATTDKFHELPLVSHYYPVDTGWLPAEATHAALQFAVKHPLSIQLLDWRYERDAWNRSLRERVLDHRNHPYVVFPPPQTLEWQEADDKVCPGALPGSNCWKELIREVTSAPKCSSLFAAECKRAFSIEGGYVITNDGRTMTVHANSKLGWTYARDTVRQLVNHYATTSSYRPSFVIDYPTIPLRAALGYDAKRLGNGNEGLIALWLAESRLNALFVEVEADSLQRWWHPSGGLRSTLAELNRTSPEIHVGALVNPYASQFDERQPYELEISNQFSRERLASVIKMFGALGVDTFVLRADDIVPSVRDDRFGYFLDIPRDIEAFGDLSNAHALLLKFLAQHTPTGMTLAFTPPWYSIWFARSSPERALAYFAGISKNVPSSIPFLWTGPTVRSALATALELQQYQKWIGARELWLWDNTLFARRHKDFWVGNQEKTKLLSFFEPFMIEYPETPRTVMVNTQLSERFRIPLATGGAYLWNPTQYEPYRALSTYLTNRFGNESTDALLEFDEAYWREAASGENPAICEELNSLLDRFSELAGEEGHDLATVLRERIPVHQSCESPTPPMLAAR